MYFIVFSEICAVLWNKSWGSCPQVRLKETDNERDSVAAKLKETETKLRSIEKVLRDREGEAESKDRSMKRLEEKIAKLEAEQLTLEVPFPPFLSLFSLFRRVCHFFWF